MNEPVRLTEGVLAELAALGIFPSDVERLHVILADEDLRGGQREVRSHICSAPLPAGSLLRVAPHVLAPSPELTFLQLARRSSLGQLIMAGCELCGTYVLDAEPQGPDEVLAKRPPLTKAQALGEFADGCIGFAGRDRARRAAQYVFDNARSPMEAKTALLLCLPPRLGGRHLPRPELNPPISLTEEAKRLHRRDYVRADLFWPAAAFDLEYDGNYHEEKDTHAKDIARIAALRSQGIDVLSVAYPQIIDPRAFAMIADQVAEQLGQKICVRREDFAEREQCLRRELGL